MVRIAIRDSDAIAMARQEKIRVLPAVQEISAESDSANSA